MDHRRTATRKGSKICHAFLDSKGSSSATGGNFAHFDLLPGRDRHLRLLYLVSDHPEASVRILDFDGNVARMPALSRSIGGNINKRMAFRPNARAALAHGRPTLRRGRRAFFCDRLWRPPLARTWILYCLCHVYLRLPALLLGSSHSDPRRVRCSGLNRHDQFRRQPGWFCGTVYYWLSCDSHRYFHFWLGLAVGRSFGRGSSGALSSRVHASPASLGS